jgi:hypothetical protein
VQPRRASGCGVTAQGHADSGSGALDNAEDPVTLATLILAHERWFIDEERYPIDSARR